MATTIIVAISSLVIAPPPAAAQPVSATHAAAPLESENLAPFQCADLLVVGARGSGETEGYGDKVGAAIDSLSSRLDATRSVRYVNLQYPAAAVEQIGDDVLAAATGSSDWLYFASVQAGTLELVDVLGDSLAYCPNERWILVGYSQGALVIDEAIGYYNTPSRYAGILKIADPGRTAGSGVQNLGSAEPGNGITVSTSWMVVSLPTNPVPAELTPITVELCMEYDIVCDTGNALAAAEGPVAVHLGIGFHSSGYPASAISLGSDVVADRALALPVPAPNRVVQTLCGGSTAFDGSVVLKERIPTSPAASWSIADGYSPRSGVTASTSNFYLAEDGWFTLDSDGSFDGDLTTGIWQIPVRVASGGYTARAQIDIYVIDSCDDAVACGPDHGPAYEPPALDAWVPESFVTGRITCPDGRPAGGVTVRLRTGLVAPWEWGWGAVASEGVTAPDGTYRLALPSVWDGGGGLAAVEAELAGFPTMTGGVAGAGFAEEFGFSFQSGERKSLPPYRLIEYGTVEGDVNLDYYSEGRVRGNAYAIGVGVDLDVQTDQSFEWCIGSAPVCASTPDNVGGFSNKVIPGTYRLFYVGGGYNEWHGSSEIDADESDTPTAGAIEFTVAEGETVTLPTKTLSRVASAGGNAYTYESHTNTAYNAAPLPVDTYINEGGQWVRNESETWGRSWLGWGGNHFGVSLLPGSYKLVVNDPSSDDYDPVYETVYYPDATHVAGAEVISVNRNTVLSLDSVFIRRADDPVAQWASVKGSVTDAAGDPVVGAEVLVLGDEYSAVTESGSDGRFSSPVLPPGSYKVHISVPSESLLAEWWDDVPARQDWSLDSAALAAASPVVIEPATDALGIDAVLAEPAEIGGSVRDADGVGVSGAQVAIYDTEGNWITSTTSNESGEYTISRLPHGTYLMHVVPSQGAPYLSTWWQDSTTMAGAESIPLAAGQTASIDPVLSPAGSVSGIVRAGGMPVAGAPVIVFRASGEYAADTVSEPNGEFTVTGLATGDYSATASAPDGMNLSSQSIGSVSVVAGTDTGSIDFALSPGATLSGTVFASGTPLKPVADITVIAYDGQDNAVGMAVTGADGRYTIIALDAGAYTLQFTDYRARGYVEEWWSNASTSDSATPIALDAAQVVTGLVTELAAKTLTSAPTPTISGSAVVGQLLTSTAGSWAPAPVNLSRQWLRNGSPISGATSSTYRLAAADAGATITVRVVGERSGYSPITRTSTPTAAVIPATLTGSTPTVSGLATVGQVLTAAAGTWAPAPVTLAYQWKRNGASISGATAATYTLAAADASQLITVTITGTKSGYTTLAKTSVGLTPAKALTATPTPTISGTARVGSALTAVPGTWGPAPVVLAYQWKRDGLAITGAVAPTYSVVAADAGKTITVTVTGTKSTYSSVARTSVATAMVTGGVISTAPVPTITGVPQVGTALTAVAGTWAPSPIVLAYQWQRNGVAIAGATTSSFTPQNAHAGGTLTVTVTGTRPGYTTVVRTSTATAVVTGGVLTSPVPTITGTTTVGSTLSASAGSWSPSPVSLTYQWKRSGAIIAGATASTYILAPGDAGATVTVTVTGTKLGFTTVAKTSASTAMVTGGVLTATPVPTISGATTVGSTLTAAAGAWTPSPVTLAYQWKRAGAAIAGATAATYVLTASDIGSAITVTVSGSRAGFTTVAKTSAALTPPRTFSTTPTPSISGTVGIGSTLTAAPGAWSPTPTFTFQWTRGGVNIAGATSASYALVAADAGQSIRVTVTGTKAGYTPVSKTSAAVVAPLVFTVNTAPTVSGTMSPGAVLTAVAVLSPTPTSVTYQWKRNGVAIPGATSSTYTVGPNDVDATITVTVIATRSGYSTTTLASPGRTVAGIVYPNCAALNLVYPHGVARVGVTADMVAGVAKPLGALTFFSTSLYNLNPGRDGDGDGVACEQH